MTCQRESFSEEEKKKKMRGEAEAERERERETESGCWRSEDEEPRWKKRRKNAPDESGRSCLCEHAPHARRQLLAATV